MRGGGFGTFPLLGHLPAIRREPLEFFSAMAREGSDLVPLKLGFRTVFLVNHPDHLKHIFQDKRDTYVRSRYYRHLVPFLGKGLFSLEGPEWRSQRATSQPAFSGPCLQAMVGEMANGIAASVDRLHTHALSGEPLDVTREAFRLKLDVVMRALFTTRLAEKEFAVVLASLTAILREIDQRVWAVFTPPRWWPSRRNRLLTEALNDLNAVIGGIIERRLQNEKKPNDLLDLLIAKENAGEWTPRSVVAIRDQVVSLVIAGHETSANALVWLIHVLSTRPDVVASIRAEAEPVLSEGTLNFEAYQRLAYTQRAVKEILRLYPPLWTFSRETLTPDRLGNTFLPRGAVVMVSPYILHRHPRFWENPEGFDPDRFTPERETERHRFLYLPFGAGPHLCLGHRFAMLEAVFAVARLIREFDFGAVETGRVPAEPMTTLRPSRPILVRVRTAVRNHELAA